MRRTRRLPRALGLALVALLASAALAISVPVVSTAGASSNTANAKTIFNAINADRAAQSTPLAPFLHNTIIDAHTQGLLTAYIKCGYPCAIKASPSPALPAGWTGGNSYGTFVSGPASVSHLASYLVSEYHTQNRARTTNFNYIGVAYEVTGSKAYAYVLFLGYPPAALPLDRVTVTLPSLATVGTTMVPIITSVTPDVSYDYQWRRAETTVIGTDPTYTPTPLDVGHTITLVVNAMKSGYLSRAVTSNATGRLPAAAIVMPHSLSLVGRRNVGQELTVSEDGWGPDGVALAVQWYRNGVKIPDANLPSYTLVHQDLGKRVDVRITGALAGYTTKYLQSHTTVKTGLSLLVTTPVPTITGATYALGSVLTAELGSWDSGVTTSITWRIAGKPVTGANNVTFTVPKAAVSHTVSVSVTGTMPGFVSATTTSVLTPEISGPAFDTLATPVISGTVRKGHVMSVTAGKFSPTPTKTAYRWYRNGLPISGATAHTHTVTTSDVGKLITVVVTVTRVGYETQTFDLG